MNSRSDRARQRRATWNAEVVQPDTSKGALYADLSPAERWAALIELNERAWIAAGHAMPPVVPRTEWPSEVFERFDRD